MAKELSLAELAAQAGEFEDQTETTTSTYDNEPPASGVTVGRFVEYIELGKHPSPDYNGKKKPDTDKVRLTFELLAPKNIKEYEHEGEKRQRAEKITMSVSKLLGEKASFKKLFNAMVYGRADKKHMAQMLGEAFILTIVHNVADKDGKKVTYANLNEKGGDYKIGAPFTTDPISQVTTPVPVPAALTPVKLFLFDRPTKGTWDSLFIEGTRTVKTGDKEEEVSKNWLQEKIMSAKNYEGSALQSMLGGIAGLPSTEEEASGEVGEVTDIAEDDEEDKVLAAAVAAAAAKKAAKAAAKKITAKDVVKGTGPAATAKTVVAAAGGANAALAALGLA